MNTFPPVAPYAVVIEPDGALAAVLADILASWGFQARAVATHGAALKQAAGLDVIGLLAACVPASEGDREGAYLATVRARQGGHLPTVLMLSHPGAADGSEPARAVTLLKPFTVAQFKRTVIGAGTTMPLPATPDNGLSASPSCSQGRRGHFRRRP